MVPPIEQRNVVVGLNKPAPLSMPNLLNLTHTTRAAVHPTGSKLRFPFRGVIGERTLDFPRAMFAISAAFCGV
jgi:hypothetical protein